MKTPKEAMWGGGGGDVHALSVNCRSCVALGRTDKIAVVILDSEVLTVVCENHPEPKRIYSVTIPLQLGPILR